LTCSVAQATAAEQDFCAPAYDGHADIEYARASPGSNKTLPNASIIKDTPYLIFTKIPPIPIFFQGNYSTNNHGILLDGSVNHITPIMGEPGTIF
jgi:hypothetical protein